MEYVEKRLRYHVMTDIAHEGLRAIVTNTNYKGKIGLFHFVVSTFFLIAPALHPGFNENMYGFLPPTLILIATAMSFSFYLTTTLETDFGTYAYIRSAVQSGKEAYKGEENPFEGLFNVMRSMGDLSNLKKENLRFLCTIGIIGTLSCMFAAWIYYNPWATLYFGIGFLILDYIAYRVFKWQINGMIYSLGKI